MRKLRIALCALCLALLVPLLIHARRALPVDTRPLVAEKYAGWSGVLRLWIFEGWPSGTDGISPWLNPCIARFEKAHPGVYVQPRFVDADAIATLNDSGILPPDMLLIPPGLLNSTKGLAALTAPEGLRPALAEAGASNGTTYAVPVALGGYLWAWNAALTDGVDGDWRETDAALAVPPAEPWRRWDAALLALCAGEVAISDGQDAPQDLDIVPDALDLDLGLAGDAPEPTPTPAVPLPRTAPRRLPAGFDWDADAWRHFVNGEAAAIPVTQREIRRLQALAGQGKGPDWRLSPGANPFTDQLLCLAVVENEDAGKRGLCGEFLEGLLSDESQGALSLAGAFSVTDCPSGYAPGDPLGAMEAVLRDARLRVPGCFDGEWALAAEAIVREFIADATESPALWRRFAASLAPNPNI